MEDSAVQRKPDPEIPDKLYFRIGEVAKLAGVKPYVLRFWENEFSTLDPKKSGTGHRLYRRKDVELVLEIKRLLYEKRFTIEGARKALEKPRRTETVNKSIALSTRKSQQQGELFAAGASGFVQELRRELNHILKILRSDH